MLLHITRHLEVLQLVSIGVKAESARPRVTLAVYNVTWPDYWWEMTQEIMQLGVQIPVAGIAKLSLPSG
jgi:hypothetical protein